MSASKNIALELSLFVYKQQSLKKYNAFKQKQDHTDDLTKSDYSINLLWCGPEHGVPTDSPILSFLQESIIQRDLSDEICNLEKEIDDLEQDLHEQNSETYLTIPEYFKFRFEFMGVDPCCYESCITCLLKRFVYPEIYGYFNCTCTSSAIFEENKNTSGFLACICDPKKREIIGIDTSNPWKRLAIKGLERYRYFHLAKWLQVPIIREGYCLKYHGDNKYHCAGMSVDVIISPYNFDLKDKGHIMIRKILKRQQPKSHDSPFNIIAKDVVVANNTNRFGILTQKRLNFSRRKNVTIYSKQ